VGWRFAAWFVAAAALIVLAACSMVGSRPAIEPAVGGMISRCASSLGSYSLPKGLLVIDVAPGSAAPLTTTVRRVADPKHRYCLDYERSALAAETIQASFDKQFLSAVYARSVDETGLLIRKIIQAAGEVSAKASALRADTALDLPATLPPVHFELDPFNDTELAAVNTRLAAYQLCFVLQGYSFDDRDVASPSSYCSAPVATQSQHRSSQLLVRLNQGALQPTPGKGLFYRPRANYELAIYGGRDGTWRLQETRTLSLENLAPIVALRVDRAAFTSKKLAFIFDEGALKQVCVKKGSEALGVVTIPVELIYGILGAPARAINARIDLATSQSELAGKTEQLLKLQDAYADYLARKIVDPTVTFTNGAPTKVTEPAPSYTAVTYNGIDAPTSLSDLDFTTDKNALCTEVKK
jgi:hypothetical protein